MNASELFSLIRAGDLAAVTACLKEDPALCFVHEPKHGSTALQVAARNKQVDIVKHLLALGAVVDALDLNNATPLLDAAMIEGNLPVVVLLLEHGANIGWRENHGCTALSTAGDAAIAEALIQYGAEVNTADSLGATPLHHKCRPFDISSAVVRVLLSAGARPDAVDNEGKTPIHVVATHPPLFFDKTKVVLEAQAAAKYLLEAHADPNAKDRYGWTPLHWAAHLGRVELVRLLVAGGAAIGARTDKGFTPLELCDRAIAEGWGDASSLLK